MKNPFIAMALASVALMQTMRADAIHAFHRGERSISPKRGNKSGKYVPHQSKRECARRVRQMAAGWI